MKSELPPDWQIVETGDGKKPYYWNTKTGKTSWKFPTAEGKMCERVSCFIYVDAVVLTPTCSLWRRRAPIV